MSYHAVTPRLFGKLPTHGDFVSRGMEPALRDQLDTWLSAEMVTARATFEAGFDDRFDTAPAVRFALDKGNGDWEGGALCPSMDSAGRRFPVMVSQAASDQCNAIAVAAKCEHAVYSGFGQRLQVDDLVQLVADSRIVDNTPIRPCGWWIEAEGEQVDVSDAVPMPEKLLSRLLEVVA